MAPGFIGRYDRDDRAVMEGSEMRTVVAMLTACLCVACSSITPEQRTELRTEASRPVQCRAGEDCAVKWGRALQWVRDHSAYRLDQSSDMVISTKGPLAYSGTPAFTITKVAKGGGIYTIEYRAGCYTPDGCHPDMLLSLKASFIGYVNGPQGAAAPAPAAKASFGIAGRPVTGDVASRLGLSEARGFLVMAVIPNSPAQRAGIAAGDVILSYDGKETNADADIRAAMSNRERPSKLTLYRGGKVFPVDVTY